jgi:hypothetical protein
VYLVTAGQRPSWLRDHANLHLVDHRDILEADALPTFNSLAIETGLHHIDGLSEQFLYMNDDVFVGKPLEARKFFHANGASSFFLRLGAGLDPAPPDPDDPPVTAGNKNVRALIEREFGRRIGVLTRHSPHALRRSVLSELEQRFSDEVRRTRLSPFRASDNVTLVTTLHHYYAYYTGRAIRGRLRHVGITLGREGIDAKVDRLDRLKPDSFSINDSVVLAESRQASLDIVGPFLRRAFPEPSAFETRP